MVRRNDQRKWIKLSGTLALAERLIETAQPCQMFGIPVVGGGVVRVQLDSPANSFSEVCQSQS